MNSNVFFLGVSGYLGGSVLVSLKKSYPEVLFKTLVRSSSLFDQIRAAGGDPVLGSHDDHELVANLSAEADVIVNVADSDDVGLLNALLEGQRRRRAGGKPVGSFVQTSGGNIFMDGSKTGTFNPNTKVWTDSEENIRSLTTSMAHGQVDVPLMKAAEDVDVNSFIICPAGIYGSGVGPGRRDSGFFRQIMGEYMRRKEVFYVGEGSNLYAFVHIEDLVSIFDRVFKLALEAVFGPPLTNPYERYYIASTVSVTWKELAHHFARELHKKGLVASPEPSSVSYEQAGPFAFMISSNLIVQPARALGLGWTPKHTTFSEEAFIEQVELASKSLN